MPAARTCGVLFASGFALISSLALLAADKPKPSAASKPAASQPASRAATGPVDEKAVAELIRLLGDDSFRVREDATRKLMGMGEAAYPLLEARLDAKDLDLEVASRINTVLNGASYAFDANEAARRQAEAARALGVPKELSLDLDGNVGLKLVLIPPGAFSMGSPLEERERSDGEVRHRVTLRKAFHMGMYHVTKGQFAAFVAAGGYKTDAEKDGWASSWDGKDFCRVDGASWKDPGFRQTADHPVVCISHNDAVAFCEWLSKKASKTVTLPTEAQWEYACRAGTTTAYQWGNDPDDGKGWCNAADQTAQKALHPNWAYFNWDDGYTFTSPAGKFKANAFGLYDMHGNAFQWCRDWYDPAYYAASPRTDPQGPATGTTRVLRGAGWYGRPVNCRSASRDNGEPDSRTNRVGFRVVVLIDPQKK